MSQPIKELIKDSEKTIAFLGDKWWSQTASEEGDKISKNMLTYGENVINAHMLEVFSIWSRNGAPSRT